jgi:hypothetical protein
MFESRVLQEIRDLDPEADHQRICFLSTCLDFPWDTTRSLEFALFRTYCVPEMTEILVGTGEFLHNAQKRYDDTVLLISELLEWGYDSERGRSALRIMNRLHGLYPIRNVDFLYVLSTFIFEPIRWNARFGWRPLTIKEKLATFHYWLAVARRMGIRDIPTEYGDFERFNRDYERAEFRYADTNRLIAEATKGVFLSWFPRPLRSLVTRGIYAMLDDPVLDAFGYPHPTAGERALVEAPLKLRARILRRLPRRSRPHLITLESSRTYGRGYRVEQLGAAAAHQPPRPPE